MHVPDEALLIKACILVTFSFKASFEVLLFYTTAIQDIFGDTLTSELFAIFAVNPAVVIEKKSTKTLTLPYLYISEPLRIQHRTVGVFEKTFLKVILTFSILFAGTVTSSLNPACRLLFNSLSAPTTVLLLVCKLLMTALVSFSTIQFQIPLNGESLFAFAAAS